MQDLFFELLRVAVGKQSCLTQTPSDEEWQSLFDMADNHALLGVCFAGLERLEKQGQRVPQDCLYEWIGAARQIEERNKAVNRQCQKLQRNLRRDGFRSCILKGQGNALMYDGIGKNQRSTAKGKAKEGVSLSLLRQSGDIDVWVEGGLEKVLRYVQSTCPTDEVNEQHVHLHVFDDTDVEVHFTPSRLANRICDRQLQRWFDSEQEKQMAHRVTFGEGEITIPTADFNLTYQMIHIYRHLFNEGVGLRQLMDYYVLMTFLDLTEEERCDVKRNVKRFGMESFAEGLMWIMGYVFHLSEEKMLWNPNEMRGRFLLSEVMQMGNFGHSDERFRLNDNDSHLKRYWQTVKSKMRFVRYFPSEALWLPIDVFLRFFEIRWLRRKAVSLRNK